MAAIGPTPALPTAAELNTAMERIEALSPQLYSHLTNYNVFARMESVITPREATLGSRVANAGLLLFSASMLTVMASALLDNAEITPHILTSEQIESRNTAIHAAYYTSLILMTGSSLLDATHIKAGAKSILESAKRVVFPLSAEEQAVANLFNQVDPTDRGFAPGQTERNIRAFTNWAKGDDRTLASLKTALEAAQHRPEPSVWLQNLRHGAATAADVAALVTAGYAAFGSGR